MNRMDYERAAEYEMLETETETETEPDGRGGFRLIDQTSNRC